MKTAWIAGASGLVGGLLIHKLVESPAYDHVISLGRRMLPIQHPKLEQKIISFDSDLASHLKNIRKPDDLFCALGTTIKKAGSQKAFRQVDYDFPLLFAQAGLKSGARKFLLVSSIGANAKSPVFYSRVKGELEETLQKMGYAELVIVRPSLIDGDRHEFRLAEKLALPFIRGMAPLMVGPLRRYRPTKASAIADCLLRYASEKHPGTSIVEAEQI